MGGRSATALNDFALHAPIGAVVVRHYDFNVFLLLRCLWYYMDWFVGLSRGFLTAYIIV